jgi:hypothetical protein
LIPKVEAEIFEEDLSEGSTRPSVMACVNLATEGRDSYVVKYRTSRGDHCYEFLCISLGRFFHLRTLEPVQVLLTRELAESLQTSHPAVAERVHENLGWNFGTRYLPGKSLPETEGKLTGTRGDEAARIMAFDVLISNADRRLRKINLLADGNGFWILDHELAFGWCLDVRGFVSWEAEARKALKDHVFKGRVVNLNFGLRGFSQRLQSLTEADIDRFFSELPDDFSCGFEGRIKNHLKRARDEHEEFMGAVLEVAK